MISQLRRQVDRVLAATLAALLAALVGVVCWQVITRFVLARPSSVTEELARFLLIWLGLLGGAHALGRGMHLSIDYLASRLPTLRPLLLQIGLAVCAAFSLFVLVGGGVQLVRITLELQQTSAALGWKLGWVYTAVPLSGLLMGFFALAEILEQRAALREGRP